MSERVHVCVHVCVLVCVHVCMCVCVCVCVCVFVVGTCSAPINVSPVHSSMRLRAAFAVRSARRVLRVCRYRDCLVCVYIPLLPPPVADEATGGSPNS